MVVAMMTSLYQKYRPQQFADLVGQEGVVKTLTQAVARDRVGHAYLFSGPKGSGKTTMARLLSKAVNCERRKKSEAEPCNKCGHCQAINEGSNLDILEIDAASHRGIEEIRELREAVKFAPSKAKRKVYIIDEVHMLTREAFNALLKTLEEPPPHALFILATTEPHKVPATIKSRTQHFLFRRAGIPNLVVYLSKVAKKEGISIEADALKLVADTADGSFRDALSSLEQVRAAYPKGSIKATEVQNLLGLADRTLVFDYLAALAKRDSRAGMAVVGELSERGIDVHAFLRHCLDVLRGLLLLLSGGERTIEQSYTAEERKKLEELRSFWGSPDVVSLMEALIAAGQLVRVSPVPELPLEMLVAELASSNKQLAVSQATSQLPPAKSSPSTTTVPVAKEIGKVDEAVWKSILSEVREMNASLYAVLREAIVLGQTADGIALGVRFRFHAELLSQAKHQSLLADAVSKVLGRPANIVVEVKPDVFTKQEEELLRMAEELL